MNTHNLFAAYVTHVGGRQQAAEQLGVSLALVGHILNGRRGVSPDVAKRIDAGTDGEISKARLRPDLWGEQHQTNHT